MRSIAFSYLLASSILTDNALLAVNSPLLEDESILSATQHHKLQSKKRIISSPEEISQIRNDLREATLTDSNIGDWFEKANALRHAFNNKDAVNLAEAIYQKANQSDLPDHEKAVSYRNQGKIFLRRGAIPEAIERLDVSLELEPKNSVTLLYLGNLYAQRTSEQGKGIGFLRTVSEDASTPDKYKRV